VGEIHSVEGFDAFVLGAPIYSGRWDHHASRFLKRHRRMLETLPVAIFALGPRDTSEEAFTRSRGQLDRSLGQVGWLRPNCVELFGGVDPPKRNRPDRRDARDWAAIRAWADALPDALHRGSVGHVDSG
jgi:menaquinone-dependent protoporphyrinogen oxidase